MYFIIKQKFVSVVDIVIECCFTYTRSYASANIPNMHLNFIDAYLELRGRNWFLILDQFNIIANTLQVYKPYLVLAKLLPWQSKWPGLDLV